MNGIIRIADANVVTSEHSMELLEPYSEHFAYTIDNNTKTYHFVELMLSVHKSS